MNITFISDTHTFHRDLNLASRLQGGDIICHSGDFCLSGKFEEALDFFQWFSELPYTHKIFIAGNHDVCFDKNHSRYDYLQSYHQKENDKFIDDIRNEIPDNIIYLEDEEAIIEGIKFWGSPVTPWFHNWAFNVNRGPQIAEYWNKMPEDVDILLTHGPIRGVLDETLEGDTTGCEELEKRVKEVKPLIISCGHIHEAYGTENKDGVLFLNSSVVNRRYWVTNKPHVIEMSEDKKVSLL